jgi:pseudaminic acid cytidylyltransferase
MNIAIIPARGGSKRVKNKNLKNFFGKPLISYSIEAAKKTKLFKKIIVSTDSIKIKKISQLLGAEVFLLRPKNLSDDKTIAQNVIKYEIKNLLKRNVNFKYVCCIYPTAPLIQSNDIKRGFKKIKNKWKFIFSACKHEKSILRSFTQKKLNKQIKFLNSKLINKNSQNLEPTFFDAGQFYWASKKNWLDSKLYFKKGSIVEVDSKFVQDLDYLQDFKILKEKFKILKKKR